MPPASSIFTSRALSRAAAAASLVASASCGSDSPTAPLVPATLTIVGGAPSDTVEGSQPLVIELRTADGRPASGLVVLSPIDARNAQGYPNIGFCTSTCLGGGALRDSVDASGRLGGTVRMGTTAGPARFTVEVEGAGLVDTITAVVRPGNAARVHVAVRDTAVLAGARYTLAASTADRFGNARPAGDPVRFAATGPGSVDATSGEVSAASLGRVRVVATVGVGADTVFASVVPSWRVVSWQSGGPGGPGLAILNSDGTQRRRITSATLAGVETIGVSGATVLFRDRDASGSAGYFVVDTSGNGRRAFAGMSAPGAALPRYSADGSSLFFMTAAEFGGNRALWRSNADGSGAVTLRGVPTVFDDWYDVTGDGRMAVGGTVTVMDLVSGGERALTSGFFPHWVAGGSLIAFAAGRAAGPLMLVAPDGSGLRQLSQNGRNYYAHLSVSPDGQWVLAQPDVGGARELIRVSDGLTIPWPITSTLGELGWH